MNNFDNIAVTCPACGKPLLPQHIGAGRTHKDHVIPVFVGGPRLDWNVELLHDTCNLSKHRRMTRQAHALAAGPATSATGPTTCGPTATSITAASTTATPAWTIRCRSSVPSLPHATER